MNDAKLVEKIENLKKHNKKLAAKLKRQREEITRLLEAQEEKHNAGFKEGLEVNKMRNYKTFSNSTLMGWTKKELIEYIRMCEHNMENANETVEQQAKNIAKLFKEQPPREKGQWEIEWDDCNTYKCTNCGELWQLNDGTPVENNMNFCPNCGADLRG